jgi:nitroreductase
MELGACIRGRRSIRAFTPRAVPRKAVDAILEAAVCAPSGMDSQPWRFVIVEDPEAIRRLSMKTKEVLRGMGWAEGFNELLDSAEDVIFYGAPLLILVCVERNPEWKSVNLLSSGMAAQNMMLAAHELGLGSCFIGFGNFLNQAPDALAEVGVPEDHELVAPLIFGHPAERPGGKPREARILRRLAKK